MKAFRALLAASLCALTAAPALAEADGPPWPAEVSVSSTRQLEFTSGINGGAYTLHIHVPLTPPPAEGYPVIYVLDGDMQFGLASDISQTVMGPAGSPVVVAIGYGFLEDMDRVAQWAPRPQRNGAPENIAPIGLPEIGMAFNARRFAELTLPVAPEHRAPAWTGLTPNNTGGVDDFLRVIEQEIKPLVAETLPVNQANDALYGHSIGGLAVLRALFTAPDAYRSFVAASPSIWWDADAVLADEAVFGAAVRSGETAPRVLIAVGGDEPDSPNPPQSFIDTLPEQQAAELTDYVAMAGQWSGMVSGARALGERLAALPGGEGYTARFVAFEGEGHASVQAAALSRGMRFAFEQ